MSDLGFQSDRIEVFFDENAGGKIIQNDSRNLLILMDLYLWVLFATKEADKKNVKNDVGDLTLESGTLYFLLLGRRRCIRLTPVPVRFQLTL